ncbi:hypothetical protein F7C95_13215 [Opitutia bacterium ISCC 51]|nr:hypothetical protein F7C95_13215 [Opitutae bacterium ISCC 51]QXD26972.1 hypothetical protein GA003_13140 [Opitutae bacterium ISCC 52]
MIRSKILRTALLSLFLITGIRGAEAQGVISLYLQADPTSHLVTNIPSDDARLASAVDLPAEPGNANLWKFIEFEDTFEGYVRKSYVTKGLTLQVGAPVYLVAGNENTFLAIHQENGTAEVIEAAGDYMKVSISASIPVFFESDTPAAAPPIPEEPIAAAPIDDFEPQSAVVEDDLAAAVPADVDNGAPYPGEPIDRILEGKLAAYKPVFSNPFKQEGYQWEILNRRKKRIAFVDPRNLIVDRPLESYEGRQVSLSGSIYQINKGRDLVIVANQLTLQ